MAKSNFRLSDSPLSLKVLITSFIATLGLGYSVSLLQIYQRTHFDMARILRYYRGAESGEDVGIVLPPTFATLLSVTHTHSFSQPVMYFLLGLLFVFTSASERWKVFFILLIFSGSVISNAAPWMIRYFSPEATLSLYLSQAMMLAAFLFMSVRILYELWVPKH